MATASNAPPPIPKPEHPVVDPRTGLMTREWYVFLKFWLESYLVVRSEIP